MDWKTRFRYTTWYRISKPFKVFGNFLGKIFSIYRVALLLIIVALAIWYFTKTDISELWPNIIPELLSIAITVFIIDTIYRRRSDEENKKVLVQKLGSQNNAVSSEALKEIGARGWMHDGTLEGAFLTSANLDGNSITGADLRGAHLSFASLRDTTLFETDLEGAFMDKVDLQGASLSVRAVGSHYAEANLKNALLSNANLKNAKVRHEQLVHAKSLWRAVMPDGKTYDGRYNLQWDINLYMKSAKDKDDPNDLASFYGVSLAEYISGQEWARENTHLFEES